MEAGQKYVHTCILDSMHIECFYGRVLQQGTTIQAGLLGACFGVVAGLILVCIGLLL